MSPIDAASPLSPFPVLRLLAQPVILLHHRRLTYSSSQHQQRCDDLAETLLAQKTATMTAAGARPLSRPQIIRRVSDGMPAHSTSPSSMILVPMDNSWRGLTSGELEERERRLERIIAEEIELQAEEIGE